MISEEETELEEVIYEINTVLEPEDGGSIDVADEIKEGEDLEFTVTVNEGYALPIVSVNGDEIEADEEDLENAEFSYLVSGIHSDTDVIDINVMFMPSNDILDQLNIEPMAIEYGINEDTLKDSYDLMPGDRQSLDGTVDHGNNDEWFFVEADGETRIDSVPGIEITGTWKRVEVDGSIATVNPGVFSEPVYIAHTYQLWEIVDYEGPLGLRPVWGYVDYIEYFKINVTNPETSAYFYVKKNPNVADSDVTSNYMYWGVGSVPFGDAEDYDVDHEYIDESWAHLIGMPEDPEYSVYEGYDSDGYPVLTDGVNYYYYQHSSEYGEGVDNYYTIDWEIYTVASGAVGPDGESYIEGTYEDHLILPDEPYDTWHVDGNVEFHKEDSIQLTPQVQDSDSIGDDIKWDGNISNILPRITMLPEETAGEDAVSVLEDWKADELADRIAKAKELGYEFGWYIKDASGNYIQATAENINALVEAGGDVIYVYGLYTDEDIPATEYKLTFDANDRGQTVSGTVPVDKIYTAGAVVDLSTIDNEGNIDIPDAVFAGWAARQFQMVFDTEEQITQALSGNTNVTMDGNKTAYALWAADNNNNGTPDYEEQQKTVTVVFDLGGVSGVSFATGTQGVSTDRQTATYTYKESDGQFGPAPVLITEGVEFENWTYTYGTGSTPVTITYDDFLTTEFDSWFAMSDPIVFRAQYKNVSEAAYTVKYTYDEVPGAPAEDSLPTGGSAQIGSRVTASVPGFVLKDGIKYILDDGNVLTITIDAEPAKNVITVNYLKDENNDNTPDSEQRLLTFDLGHEYNAKFPIQIIAGINASLSDNDTELTYIFSSEDTVTYPEAPSIEEDILFDMSRYVTIVGWEDENGKLYDPADENIEVGGKKVYTAVYERDSDNDGIPDSEEKVTIQFVISEADKEKGSFWGTSDLVVSIEEEAGSVLTAPVIDDTEADGWIHDGWSPDVPKVTPEENTTYTAVWARDENNDNIKDSDQIKISFSLKDLSGEDHGAVFTGLESDDITVDGTGKKVTFWYNVGDTYADAPSMDNISVDGWAVSSWQYGNADYSDTLEGNVATEDFTDFEHVFKAVWAEDANNDGIPDAEETTVYMRPFATTIYSGGSSGYDQYDGTGFPELELEVKLGSEFAGDDDRGDRGARNELVTEVNINGKWFTCTSSEGINEFLEAIYVYATEDGGYEIINDDSEYRDGGYRAVIAVKDTALGAFGEGYVSDPDTGLIRNTDNDNRYVTISEQSDEGINSIGVKAYESLESSTVIDYVVNFTTSSMSIRETVGEEADIYKDVETNESDVNVAEDNEATAFVPADAEGNQVYYTNGDDRRTISDDTGIVLLEDDVRTDDNRIDLIEDKGYQDAYGMTAEEAEAAGYRSMLKYYDLIDNNNGNAWVQSVNGTYVYIPYPEGTDQNTEFELRHFKGLHRDTNYEGDEVADAIAASELEDGEDLQFEKTEQGLRFFTIGEDAFSPFMLMWKTDGTEEPGTDPDTPVTPEEPDSGDDDDPENGGGSGSGSGSGGHNESDRNSIGGTYYTVGVNGNWRHMDNVDVNAPLDEAVPAGATAMAAPEWHRWKFFRNDGSNIRSQWAHIANPYAVDDQPKTGWFYFDAEGLMQYGWFLDTTTGKWYYLHAESDGMLGTMVTGWHYDLNDGRWYYLDPATGEMLLGWQNIGGKWYYFNTAPNEQTWNLDSLAGLWRFNNSTARPLGSMYINEKTPDGYQVDGSGAWIQ